MSSPVCLAPLKQTVQRDWYHGLHWSTQNLHILAGILSLDILYLEEKILLLMSKNFVIEGLDCPSAKPASLDVSWMDNENWRAPMSIQDNKI